MYKLLRGIINYPGFKTNRKIVVFESDDWGSIRMPSKDVYEKCLEAGYPVDLNPFERYDSLASTDDLNLLFDLLSNYKDMNGRNPIITANCVVANPDFEKIKADKFQNYHYELINETFKKYPNHSRNLEIWLQAKAEGIFFPQYHAREHLNVSKFMLALQNNDSDIHFAFDNRMPGAIKKGRVRNGNYYVEATHYNNENDKNEKRNIYLEGLELFEDIFGYRSQSITPTNYTWSREYNKYMSEVGVKYIQGVRKMKEPTDSGPNYQNRKLGSRNEYNQIDLVRNCDFEPTVQTKIDSVDACLSDIKFAFMLNKPAVISSHRINFVGNIDVNNRDRNLKDLNQILKIALNKWPDIEFMTSVDLGELITNNL